MRVRFLLYALLVALSGYATCVSGPARSGTAKLHWWPPTTNTDGTPISDLAGYIIQYGKDPASLTQSVDIKNAAANSYTLKGLSPGTWYFAVSCYTARGARSTVSNVASKTIK